LVNPARRASSAVCLGMEMRKGFRNNDVITKGVGVFLKLSSKKSTDGIGRRNNPEREGAEEKKTESNAGQAKKS